MKRQSIGTGLILVLIGVVWLLNATGMIDFNLLYAAGQLWPLFLIGVGFSIVFKQRKMLVSIIWVTILIVIIAYGVFFAKDNTLFTRFIPHAQEGMSAKTSNFIPLDKNTETGELELNLGGTDFNLGSTLDGLAELKTDIPYLKYNYTEGSRAKLNYYMRGSTFNVKKIGSKFSLNISENIPWDIKANIGAIKGEMNLTDIDVRTLDIDMGAGDIELLLGEKGTLSRVDIDAGVADMKIVVPDDAGIRVKIDGALKTLNFEGIKVIKNGNEYVSLNYEEKQRKIDFDVDLGVSSITISTFK